MYIGILFITITSVCDFSVKAYRALCFPLNVVRSAMACFHLLCIGCVAGVILVYDTEVICVYGTEPV